MTTPPTTAALLLALVLGTSTAAGATAVCSVAPRLGRSPHHTPRHLARHQRRRFAAAAGPDGGGGGERGGDPSGRQGSRTGVVGQSKDPVTAFFNSILPQEKASREDGPVSPEEVAAASALAPVPKAKRLSVSEMSRRIAKGLRERSWFVTGRVDSSLFSDNFTFTDPSVSAGSLEEYCRGVSRFFTQGNDGAFMEVIDVIPVDDRTIEIVWYLDARVNLPFKPRIKPYVVVTTFKLDREGLVVYQEDKFQIPEWEIVLSAFLPFPFGSPPAPGPRKGLKTPIESERNIGVPGLLNQLIGQAPANRRPRQPDCVKNWAQELKYWLAVENLIPFPETRAPIAKSELSLESDSKNRARRISQLIAGLSSVPMETDLRFLSGTGRVVWEGGLLPWKAFRGTGGSGTTASQTFDFDKRTVKNVVRFSNSSEIAAFGTFKLNPKQDELVPGFVRSPISVEASIARTEATFGTRSLNLPVSGDGAFEILFMDKDLRIFRSPSSGGTVLQIREHS